MQELKLADDLLAGLKSGRKTCTIRAGKRDITCGLLVFSGVDSWEDVAVMVANVAHKKLAELTDAEAQLDGAESAEGMAETLKRFYPTIDPDSDITVVEFYKV